MGKDIAIHKELSKEWTGIRLDTGEKITINPHTEKLEALQDLLAKIDEL